MEQLSFFEKLQVLGSNILAHPLFIILLLLPVILIALNKKITKKVIILLYLGVLLIVLFVGNSTIFKLFDNMIDGLFMTLYFPNFITLFVVVVVSAIITLVTFLKKHITKVIKIINITGFAIVQTLFCLILTTVQVNNIDIYKDNALYSSSEVLTLMQLLMGAFALQIIAVIVIYAIDKVTGMLDEKDGIVRNNKIEEQLDNLKQTRIINHKPWEMEVVLEPQKPLDKSLIDKVKLSPVSLEEAINKKLQEKISHNTVEKPDLLKPMEEKTTHFEEIKPQPILEPKEPKFIPKVPEVQEKNEITQKLELPKEISSFEKEAKPEKMPIIEDTIKEEIVPKNQEDKRETKIQDKPKVEKLLEKITNTEVKNDEKPIFKNVIKATPIPKVEAVTPKVEPIKIPEKSIPKAEPFIEKASKVEVKTEPEEDILVSDLNIVNFDKTLKVIRNLKRMYTM